MPSGRDRREPLLQLVEGIPWKPARRRLTGDTARQASSGEVKDLRREMHDLKEALAEQVLENRLPKKNALSGVRREQATGSSAMPNGDGA